MIQNKEYNLRKIINRKQNQSNTFFRKKGIISLFVIMMIITSTILIPIVSADQLDQEAVDIISVGGWLGGGNKFAQVFYPSLDVLTRVKLFVTRGGNPSGDLICLIYTSLDGNALTSISVPASSIPAGGYIWSEFNFPNIIVNPGQKHYIVLDSSSDNWDEENHITWWQTSNYGEHWFYNSVHWLFSSYEQSFSFQTYGELSGGNHQPNTPSNPDPANHATNVSINTDLSWTNGDPDSGDTVTYDVYFGTNSYPPIVSIDQSYTSYDPGTMNFNTKYYWRIVAEDNHGITVTGPVWDFTTATNPRANAFGPYTGTKCNPVQFNGSVTGGLPPYTWDWNFGDNTAHSNQQNPTHRYSNDRQFTVTLKVTDSQQAEATTSAFVTISTSDLIVDANGPYSGGTGASVIFSGNASGGCTPYLFSWDFGDGDESDQQNPSHIYSSSGTYIVTLTVTDDSNDSVVDTSTATILEPDLECEGTLSWVNVVQGTIVNGTFIVRNVGDLGSSLNWEIGSYPEDWGEWTFTPSEGSDLSPEDGDITVEVTLVVPKAKSLLLYRLDDTKEFTGDVVVVNKDNTSDNEVTPVSITVSKGKLFSLIDFFEYLMYLFPFFEKILNQIYL